MMDKAPFSDSIFNQFYNEVKTIEKKDSVMTPKQQIERLLRPGSKYFNLNPYEVLQLPTDTSTDDVKKQYKKLSILVHPDKNPDDRERAQQAFDIVNKAYKVFEDNDALKRVKDIIDEGKARTDLAMQDKRRNLKKLGKPTEIEEDDPEIYKKTVYANIMKVFVDRDRKRQLLEDRDQEERKRQREAELDAEEKAQLEKEWQKNFEESRDERVSSWKNFQDKKIKKSKKATEFRPPKHKAEQRT